jgi:microcystin-dependent protein
MAYNFDRLNGSDPAGHTSINSVIDSIDATFTQISTGLVNAVTGAVTTGQVLRWDGSTFAKSFVDATSLAASSVIESKIDTSAVTTNKIADLNVTTGKIANDAVTLGTKTSGDYVATITGTAGQIASSAATSGEGTNHTLSIVSDATIPGRPVVGTATGTYPFVGSARTISDVGYVNDAVSQLSGGTLVALGGSYLSGTAAAAVINPNVITANELGPNVVNMSELALVIQQMLNPVGTVQAYAGASSPTGWLICDGSTVPNGSGTVQSITANYSALYAILGSSFGSAGKLPDLRGRTAIGAGTGTGLTARSLGVSLGDEKLQAHTHSAGYTVAGTNVAVGTHHHNVYFRYIDYYGTSNYSPAGNAGQYGFGDGVTSGEGGAHNHTWSGTISGNSGPHNQAQGDGQNMQPSQALTYIIKY